MEPQKKGVIGAINKTHKNAANFYAVNECTKSKVMLNSIKSD